MIALAVLLVPAALAVGIVVFIRILEAVHARRAAAVARQIALTEAVHGELGAFAAPLVRRRGGRWEVVLAVPLGHPAVARLVGLTHALLPTAAVVLVPRPDPRGCARTPAAGPTLAPAGPGSPLIR